MSSLVDAIVGALMGALVDFLVGVFVGELTGKVLKRSPFMLFLAQNTKFTITNIRNKQKLYFYKFISYRII